MIKIDSVSMKYSDENVLDNVSFKVKDGSIHGIVGSNGAGKSTILRMMCGVYKCDSGRITYDGRNVYENTEVKSDIVYISDDQYFYPHSSMKDMADIYKAVYNRFSFERFTETANMFSLDIKRKLDSFSKGMLKQAFISIALACNTKYILFDETFDGLDPVMRQKFKSMIASEIAEERKSIVIASHNLRDLDEICDHITLLHSGGVVVSDGIDETKSEYFKVQAVLPEDVDLSPLDILSQEKSGSVSVLIIKAGEKELNDYFSKLNLRFFEILPMTLDELYIVKMKEAGYEAK